MTLRSCSARLKALSACAETTSPPMTSVAQTASDAPRVTSLGAIQDRDLPIGAIQAHPFGTIPGIGRMGLDFLSGDVAFEGFRHVPQTPMGLEGRYRQADVVVPRDVGETRCRPIDALATGSASSSGRSSRSSASSPSLVARQQQTQGLAAQGRRGAGTRGQIHAERARRSARRPARRRPIERSGYDALLATIKHGLFNDQRVVRVRVWRADGFSSSRPTTHPRSASPRRPTRSSARRCGAISSAR